MRAEGWTVASAPFVRTGRPLRKLVLALALKTGWTPQELLQQPLDELLDWAELLVEVSNGGKSRLHISHVAPVADPRTLSLPPALIAAIANTPHIAGV